MNVERTKHLVIATVLLVICTVGILMMVAYFQMPKRDFDPLAITQGPLIVTPEPQMRTAISNALTATAQSKVPTQTPTSQ
ncbi:MAG: hypothetical protein GC179_28980 [Anaerolineaceae bacterium]|nr:hypothetical protein [Anaerolineaceae bacterium]